MNYHIVKIYWHRWSDKITYEWIAKRISFFKQYTLKSLQTQSFKDFSLWFCCDPGMEKAMEPLTDVPGIFTFGKHYSAASSGNPTLPPLSLRGGEEGLRGKAGTNHDADQRQRNGLHG